MGRNSRRAVGKGAEKPGRKKGKKRTPIKVTGRPIKVTCKAGCEDKGGGRATSN